VTRWVAQNELTSLFDPKRQLQSVGEILERLGLGGPESDRE
jgi:hypothetical protein